MATIIMPVRCGTEWHHVKLGSKGRYKLLDHDMEVINAFVAFKAEPPACLVLAQKWHEDPIAALEGVLSDDARRHLALDYLVHQAYVRCEPFADQAPIDTLVDALYDVEATTSPGTADRYKKQLFKLHEALDEGNCSPMLLKAIQLLLGLYPFANEWFFKKAADDAQWDAVVTCNERVGAALNLLQKERDSISSEMWHRARHGNTPEEQARIDAFFAHIRPPDDIDDSDREAWRLEVLTEAPRWLPPDLVQLMQRSHDNTNQIDALKQEKNDCSRQENREMAWQAHHALAVMQALEQGKAWPRLKKP